MDAKVSCEQLPCDTINNDERLTFPRCQCMTFSDVIIFSVKQNSPYWFKHEIRLTRSFELQKIHDQWNSTFSLSQSLRSRWHFEYWLWGNKHELGSNLRYSNAIRHLNLNSVRQIFDQVEVIHEIRHKEDQVSHKPCDFASTPAQPNGMAEFIHVLPTTHDRVSPVNVHIVFHFLKFDPRQITSKIRLV